MGLRNKYLQVKFRCNNESCHSTLGILFMEKLYHIFTESEHHVGLSNLVSECYLPTVAVTEFQKANPFFFKARSFRVIKYMVKQKNRRIPWAFTHCSAFIFGKVSCSGLGVLLWQWIWQCKSIMEGSSIDRIMGFKESKSISKVSVFQEWRDLIELICNKLLPGPPKRKQKNFFGFCRQSIPYLNMMLQFSA